MQRAATTVPPELAGRDNRVLRPRDVAGVYAQPRPEVARLAANHVLLRLASGYYALAPQRRVGDARWRPSLEGAALGIAQADYGPEAVALVGVSAARHHGAIPRPVATAVVAVPKQRPALATAVGRIAFTRRDVGVLDVERVVTDLTAGWVTTREQTLLDLAARPALGDLPATDIETAIRTLAARADWDLVEHLAADQRRSSAVARVRDLTRHPDAP